MPNCPLPVHTASFRSHSANGRGGGTFAASADVCETCHRNLAQKRCWLPSDEGVARTNLAPLAAGVIWFRGAGRRPSAICVSPKQFYLLLHYGNFSTNPLPRLPHSLVNAILQSKSRFNLAGLVECCVSGAKFLVGFREYYRLLLKLLTFRAENCRCFPPFLTIFCTNLP